MTKRSKAGSRTVIACLIALVLIFPGLLAAAEPLTKATLVFKSGAVYTMNPRQPWAEAVAVAGGNIVAVGSDSVVESWVGPKTRVIDLKGGMLLPGFQDSHLHLIEAGVEMGQCSLAELETPEDILEAVSEYADEHPEETWILGGGWELTSFPEGNPDRKSLDAIVPDRPVLLFSTDGHSAWVNSKALALAGITAKTPDCKDGRIERRPGSREPSGTLRESAVDPVAKLAPQTSAVELAIALKKAQAEVLEAGITSAIDARTEERLLKAYAAADQRGDLRLKLWASVVVDPDRGPKQIPELVAQRERFRTPRLNPAFAKIFADGVIEAHTAVLVDPYTDRPDTRGKKVLETSAFNALAEGLEKAGFQIHVHAIGDGAVRQTLDALAHARRSNNLQDRRHQIAHLELIHPDDLPRFRELGVVADFQPLWAMYDSYISDLTEPQIGPERAERLYPIGSVLRTGAVLAAGSDWSVSSVKPLEALQVAVTRQDWKKPSGKPWLPAERIDLAAALAAYTINGAFLTHEESRRGSIEVGKCADLVALDRNLFAIPPETIARTTVLMTIVDGTPVYEASEPPSGLPDEDDDE